MPKKIATIKRVIKHCNSQVTVEVQVPKFGSFRIDIPDGKHHGIGRCVPVLVTQNGRKTAACYAG